MAGIFQQFLKGVGDGFFGSDYLRDYKHASKTFITSGFANAPKFKWLFHVHFDINKSAVAGDLVEKIFPKETNLGLLVKSIDLPKFSIHLEEMNQYNRKKLVQTKINYDPLRIVFHDDNANQVRHLWHSYFNYYYYDPRQPDYMSGNSRNASSELNTVNTYDPDIRKQSTWGLKGDVNNSDAYRSGIYNTNKTPFFRSIKVYGFNQHNFALYEIINPMIESFSHDNYNYYETRNTMENTMTIKYETVKYYEGAMNGQSPDSIVEQFGSNVHYDTQLSPLSAQGTNASIMGKNGLIDSGLGILEDLASGDPARAIRALQTGGRLSRTWKNGSQIIGAAKSEIVSGIAGEINKRGVFNFPAAGATTGTASQTANAKNSTSTLPPVVNRDIPPGV